MIPFVFHFVYQDCNQYVIVSQLTYNNIFSVNFQTTAYSHFKSTVKLNKQISYNLSTISFKSDVYQFTSSET